MVFPVVVYWCESWTIKKAERQRIDAFFFFLNWCFWTVVLEKALEIPLDYKEIKLVTPKGNQSWIFIERTDTEASILWPPDAKNWLIGKDPDAGEDWRQEEKETIEDEIVGWHHQLDGHEFEQAPGVSDRQGSLVCCRPPSMGSQRIGHDWMTELNCILFQGFPSGSAVKNLPTLQETWETEVQSLGGEDPLEKGMATHSRLENTHGQRSLTGYSP